MLNVFVGYDQRQPIAFHVLSHSIWKNTTHPVAITQLKLSTLPIKRRGLTEFTFSRFLTPYLCDFKDYSLFMDSDMLCRADIIELLAYVIAYPEIPVFVVKSPQKFEWPSLMLFNNALCQTLTPAYVDSGANILFDFKWASDVGQLPKEWNHLVGYDAPNPNAKVVHFTKGIPIWEETKQCEFHKEWVENYVNMCASVDFKTLMGKSVHVTAGAKK